MEICLSFPEDPNILDYVQVSKKIGTSKFSVYKVHSPTRRSDYALKVFPKTKENTAQYNKEKLIFYLNHPNIIQSIPITCHHSKFDAILTEYVSYGSFYDIVEKGVLNSDILVRTYFHQLIEGLQHVHSRGIAHLDLKLENLMMGPKFQLKIIDFDHAQFIKDNHLTSGGTKDYRAPEMLRGNCKDLAALDIYSAGIILFAFKAREFPFNEENGSKPGGYDYYAKEKSSYWELKAQQKEKGFFSENFIELVNGMVHQDVNQRFEIKDIKESKWYKGPILNSESLKMAIKDKIGTSASK